MAVCCLCVYTCAVPVGVVSGCQFCPGICLDGLITLHRIVRIRAEVLELGPLKYDAGMPPTRLDDSTHPDTTPTGTLQVYTHRQHTATNWNATKQAG